MIQIQKLLQSHPLLENPDSNYNKVTQENSEETINNIEETATTIIKKPPISQMTMKSSTMLLSRPLLPSLLPLLDLPNELILQIHIYLDPVSQACLSLSCKCLLNLIGPISLHHNEFRFPLLSVDKGIAIPYKEIPKARSTLLKHLQDDRWKYCRLCFKLHPRMEWMNPAELDICMYNAGISILCPCIQLTPRAKVELIRWIKRISQSTEDEIDLAGPFHRQPQLRAFSVRWGDSDKNRVPVLRHECPEGQDGMIRQKITMIFLNERGELMVLKDYDTEDGVIECAPSLKLRPWYSWYRDNAPGKRTIRNLGGESYPTCQLWRWQRSFLHYFLSLNERKVEHIYARYCRWYTEEHYNSILDFAKRGKEFRRQQRRELVDSKS